MKKPAIVIPAYNRIWSLSRLLTYVNNAKYAINDITLVISIDGGGDNAVKELAEVYEWKHGEKRIILHDEHLGLKNHILCCGDLTQEYGSILMLEDDLIVSSGFYSYALQAINEYASNPKIAGISLYLYRCNENASWFPFMPLDNGFDAFFLQVPSSWGQAWTSEQWKRFKDYYTTYPLIPEDNLLPSNVSDWPDSSWKKHFYNYMLVNDLYFVYPYLSHTSNWGDVGTHFQETNSMARVQLSMISEREYHFPHFSKKSVAYDGFFEILPDYLKDHGFYSDYDFGVDLFGTKDLSKYSNTFFLSLKTCNNSMAQFGTEMIPVEQNVIFSNQGTGISFAKRVDFNNKKENEKLYAIACQCQQTVFSYGLSVGIREGELKKSKSLSYRIGRRITAPFRLLKSLFER